jgi:prepilin-type N-terminal cleavage/methylation domain-containing protein
VIPLCVHKTNRGFTLIELLVAMALGLVVLGAILTVFVSQSQTNAAQQEIAYAQQNVRAAMDLMVREIRNAGYDPLGNGFEVIPLATAVSIQIRSDIDVQDGTPDDANEDVTYGVNASDQLERNGTRIVDFVDNLEFGYVLEDGTMLDPPGAPLTATQRDDIRAVIIRLAVRTENPAPDTREFRVRSMETGVRIRNLGFQDIP